MIVELIKPWKNRRGREIPPGRQIFVTNEKGKEMIKEGYGKEADKDAFDKMVEKKFNDGELKLNKE